MAYTLKAEGVNLLSKQYIHKEIDSSYIGRHLKAVKRPTKKAIVTFQLMLSVPNKMCQKDSNEASGSNIYTSRSMISKEGLKIYITVPFNYAHVR